jgi:hypothetical protein
VVEVVIAPLPLLEDHMVAVGVLVVPIDAHLERIRPFLGWRLARMRIDVSGWLLDV